jgi:hypothetical protein
MRAVRSSCKSPSTILAVTDLPDPDSPTSATRSPGLTESDMPCSTSVKPV